MNICEMSIVAMAGANNMKLTEKYLKELDSKVRVVLNQVEITALSQEEVRRRYGSVLNKLEKLEQHRPWDVSL